MKTLKTLADRFGLSQQHLADFLCVSKSMLSQLNNGIKPMPNNYMVQLQQLMTLDAGKNKDRKKKIRTLATTAISQDSIAQLQSMILDIEIKLRLSQKKLTSLQQQWNESIKTATFCALAEVEELSLNEKQQRWLQELKYRTEALQTKCSPDKQMLLAIQVQLLKAQLYILKRAAPIKQQISSA